MRYIIVWNIIAYIIAFLLYKRAENNKNSTDFLSGWTLFTKKYLIHWCYGWSIKYINKKILIPLGILFKEYIITNTLISDNSLKYTRNLILIIFLIFGFKALIEDIKNNLWKFIAFLMGYNSEE